MAGCASRCQLDLVQAPKLGDVVRKGVSADKRESPVKARRRGAVERFIEAKAMTRTRGLVPQMKTAAPGTDCRSFG